jgi:hypothetical protein
MTVTSSPAGEHAGTRHTVDTITSDALDELYARLDAAEQETEATATAAAHLTILMGKRSEKAERAAEKQRQRANIAETELRILRTGLRANGADPTQLQNLWAQISLRNRQWRDAKAVIARVRDLADRWDRDAPPPGNRPLTELRTALAEPKED